VGNAWVFKSRRLENFELNEAWRLPDKKRRLKWHAVMTRVVSNQLILSFRYAQKKDEPSSSSS